MDKIVDFIVNTNWEGFPIEVRDKVSLCAMDDLAATVTGRHVPVSQITAGYACVGWPGTEATIISTGEKAAVTGAAFANAYAANAIDIDDCGLYTKGHPGAQLFSTALAITEKLNLSGRALLASLIVGYELGHRIGRCWHHYHDTFRACGSWGSVACAAVAARLLGLDEHHAKQALGIAEYHAPLIPLMRDVSHPKMAKHGIGMGSLNGILAAELAARGFTAPESMLSSDNCSKWVTDIGSEYIMQDGICWKEHACCAWVHPTLDALSKLRSSHVIQLEKISKITVYTFHEAAQFSVDLPTTTEEAQFSLVWPVAAFLVDGEVGPHQVSKDYLSSKKVRKIAHRVEVVELSQLTEAYRNLTVGKPGGRMASAVKIITLDGMKLDSGIIEGNVRYPFTGWNNNRMREKFLRLVTTVHSERQSRALLELASKLDELPSVRGLVAKAAGVCGTKS